MKFSYRLVICMRSIDQCKYKQVQASTSKYKHHFCIKIILTASVIAPCRFLRYPPIGTYWQMSSTSVWPSWQHFTITSRVVTATMVTWRRCCCHLEVQTCPVAVWHPHRLCHLVYIIGTCQPLHLHSLLAHGAGHRIHYFLRCPLARPLTRWCFVPSAASSMRLGHHTCTTTIRVWTRTWRATSVCNRW